MRIRNLQIPAYGPFTDFSLDFPQSDSDFHLIYGSNEAGKSSLLRAIRALLFGIPGQTTDNFQHDYNQLRILAELEDSKGATRTFQRRKGNRNTLLDKDGSPTAETELHGMLGVVDENYFNNMFGLGSEELRQGADELLRGEGQLGQALFSASLGGTPVDQVIETLEAEAAGLYAGRAWKGVRIREALKQHNEALKEKKEALIKPEAWEEVERGLSEVTALLEGLATQRNEANGRKEWLERCRDALPMVGQLAERRGQLDDLPELPDLPSSFADAIRETRSGWLATVQEVERKGEDRDRLLKRAQDCALQPDVLEVEAAIDTIHTGIGSYRENKSALAAKQGEAQAKEGQVRVACRDLGISVTLEDLDELRITGPQLAQAEQRAGALEGVTDAHASSEQKARELKKEIGRLREEPADGDSEKLAHLKDLLPAATVLEATAADLAAREKALATLQRTISDLHGELAGAPEDLKATRDLKLPPRVAIEQFSEHLEQANRAAKDIAKEKRGVERAIRELEAEIERRERQRDLPSLDDLKESRRHRDHGWDLVLQDWKGAGAQEAFDEDQPLQEAYPEAVATADSIADRLRNEAEAVAQREESRTKLKLERENLKDLETRSHESEAEAIGIATKWAEKWDGCHSDPATPREMMEWRETWLEFTRDWDRWRIDLEQLESDRQQVAEVRNALAEAMEADGSDFQDLLRQAKERFEELDGARVEAATAERKIKEAEGTLEDLTLAIPKLKDELESAADEWARCTEDLSLDGALAPRAQIEALRARREMFRDFDDWKTLLGECARFEDRTRDYEASIADLASKLGLETAETEILEGAVWSQLERAKSAQATHDDLQARIVDLSDDQEAARGEAERERERFDTQLAKAELADEADLDTFLANFEERFAHREKVEGLREGLAGLSRGTAVDEFVSKIEEEDAESLEASLAALVDRLSELDREIEEARAERQKWETRRTVMEAENDEAARHEQEAAFAISRMKAHAERFVQLRVAIKLLRDQIDTFRQQNQGPFMEKASHWFAEVTGGAFSGIGTCFDEGDEPVIAGQRGGDGAASEVLVSGMSEGTRDQLYLALRLAGLELHLQDHEPMPMILDDLLLHFDDARAQNALQALQGLAQGSQVLLFTHHAHLVELARTYLGAGSFHLHEIG